MNESEKVSSPSAALPDVRALIAEARRIVPARDVSCGLSQRERLIHDLADALEAALRSRERERAEPADALLPVIEEEVAMTVHGAYAHECGDGDQCRAIARRILDDYDVRLRPAQPEEAAQRPTDLETVFEKIAHLPRVTWDPEADEPGSEGSYPEYVDVQDVLEIVLAAQRATPSAPTPNDLRYILPALEKAIPILRAAITDETGTADALDRLRTDLEKRAALAHPSGSPCDEDALKARVEGIIATWRDRLDLGDVEIQVQVGSLEEYGEGRHAATFGPAGCWDESVLIAVAPSAEHHEAGLEHIVVHELVHVAHGQRFPDPGEMPCDDSTEWLIDEIARLLRIAYSEPEAEPAQRATSSPAAVSSRPSKGRGPVSEPSFDAERASPADPPGLPWAR